MKTFNYVFSKIPNDDEGRELVRLMRKHLNRDRFKLEVYGQNVKDELKRTGVTYWGQKASESKNLRIYIRDYETKRQSLHHWREARKYKEALQTINKYINEVTQ